jgi:hypothetical protein
VKLAQAPILSQVVQLYREKGTLEFPSSFHQGLDDLEIVSSLELMEPVDAASICRMRPLVGIV